MAFRIQSHGHFVCDICLCLLTLNDEFYLCVLFSISLLSRCVPDPTHLAELIIQSAAKGLAANKTPEAVIRRQESTKQFFQMIELDDVFQKFLSDIYTAWRQILALCGIAVGENSKC